ncbi:LAMI_0D07404g1_1 [Lachancea mirantina]|uniref:LAMI_0D07404g1_1 n=1 Tax=Lachancea mirantina TaxID=1230905 RepID=A0A1G4JCA9_9SACH|nr:LAMI_0D07404g1_1 [Lachancea mirantina]
MTVAEQVKPALLFIAKPDEASQIYHDVIQTHFQVFSYEFSSSDPTDFLRYLKATFDSKTAPLRAIYCGYMAFAPIGGLTAAVIEHEAFPKDTLQCLALCSRGINGIDIDQLMKYGIQVYNNSEDASANGQELSLVGNDVADCVLWHVLEGFRKFSYIQTTLRDHQNTIVARYRLTGCKKKDPEFAFGHVLANRRVVTSPRGHKALVLGMGSLGKQIAHKLEQGLGMQVHYSKRTCDAKLAWQFHPLDETLFAKLAQFSTVVIALPGTPETRHLVDTKFLESCSSDLILVNVGRGFILEKSAVEKALKSGKIRHLGLDVFYNEPVVEDYLVQNLDNVSITPHVGSSTASVFYQSCEHALSKIVKTVLDKE